MLIDQRKLKYVQHAIKVSHSLILLFPLHFRGIEKRVIFRGESTKQDKLSTIIYQHVHGIFLKTDAVKKETFCTMILSFLLSSLEKLGIEKKGEGPYTN